MHDAWFADEDQIRKTVGLLEKPVFQNPNPREVRHGCLGFKTGQSCNWIFLSSAAGAPFIYLLISQISPLVVSLLAASVLKLILLVGLKQLLVVIPTAFHVGQVLLVCYISLISHPKASTLMHVFGG